MFLKDTVSFATSSDSCIEHEHMSNTTKCEDMTHEQYNQAWRPSLKKPQKEAITLSQNAPNSSLFLVES